MILFFDTETNGVARDYTAPPSTGDNWPRMTQLAYVLATNAGDIVARYQTLIQPDGWEVPTTEFFVKNGMSTARCAEFGISATRALAQFVQAVEACDTIIAHNIRFDYGVVGSEMMRYGIRANKRPERHCTMEALTPIMQLPSTYPGKYKWPKLEEAYCYVTGKEMVNAHDAMGDVDALVEMYFTIQRKSNATV